MKIEKLNSARILSVTILFMILSPMIVQADIGNPNPGVLPPNSNPNGLTYGEWSAKWWQWAVGIPAANNPVLDTNGQYCAEGQSGDVWFLAGTFGGSVVRKCTIPSDKSIFIPIVNIVNIATEPDETADQMRELSNAYIDNTKLLEATIDGISLKDLQNYRADSPAFFVTFPEGNIVGLEPGTYGPAVSDGFWLMFAPLEAGSHELTVHGKVQLKNKKEFETKTTYYLTVTGRGI